MGAREPRKVKVSDAAMPMPWTSAVGVVIKILLAKFPGFAGDLLQINHQGRKTP